MRRRRYIRDDQKNNNGIFGIDAAFHSGVRACRL